MFKSKIFLKGITVVLSIVTVYTLIIFFFALPKLDALIQNLEERNGKQALSKVVWTVKNVHDDLQSFKQEALNNHKQELQKLTDTAWSVINAKYDQSRPENIGSVLRGRGEHFKQTLMDFYRKNKKNMSPDELKKAIINYINIYRYDQNSTGYFWINDFDGMMIVHPIKTELNDTNVYNFKDPNGVYLFQEFIKECNKNGSGIVKYQWYNPVSKKVEDKISYVFTFKPFNWIVGTGEYYSTLKERLQNEVIDLVSKLRYGNNNYFYISDYNSVLISHPYLQGKDFSNITDQKGNLIVPPMVEVARSKGEGFHEYWWKKNNDDTTPYEKLTYSKDFPLWKMVIGTGIYIDDIESEITRRKSQLMDQLREIVKTTQVGKTGYLYIFDGEGNMLVHPNSNIDGTNFKALKNPSSGSFIFDDLLHVSKTGKNTLYYQWDKPSDKGNYVYSKISWISYIKEMDWYVCSSAYVDEFRESSQEIRDFIIILALIILFAMGGYSFIFLKNLLTPISNLSRLALRVTSGDFSRRCNASDRNDEIGTLSNEFNKMIDTIEHNIEALDAKVAQRTLEVENEKKYVSVIMNAQNNMVLASDGKVIRTVNNAFLKFYEVKDLDEFFSKYGVCICDTFKKHPGGNYITKRMGDQTWLEYVFQRPDKLHKAIIEKGGKEYIFTIATHEFEFNGEKLNTTSFSDVTELEQIKNRLEHEKKYVNFVMNAQDNMVLTSDGKTIRSVNSSFLQFFEVDNLEDFVETYGVCVCDTFKIDPKGSYITKHMGDEGWLEYVFNRPEQIHKTIIEKNGIEYIFTITTHEFDFDGEKLKTTSFSDVTELERIKDNLENEKKYVNFVMNAQENMVLTSDGKTIRSVNSSFLDFYNVTDLNEFVETYGVCVCDTFKKDPDGHYITKEMGDEGWLEYIFNRPDQIHKTIIEKDGKEFIFTISTQEFEFDGEKLKTTSFSDVTELEKIRNSLEHEKKYVDFVMNAQENMVLTSDGKTIRSVNSSFLDFYNVTDLNEFVETYGVCVCDTFKKNPQGPYITKKMGDEGWLEYIFNRPAQIHKTIVEKDGKEYIFTISTQEFEFEGEKLKTTSFSDVTELERIKTKFESIYNDLKSSIEYASLIQNSVVPEEKLFNRCFRDHFVLWHQKDIVGGDIYLFEELRHEEEFLMMVIDCTGHGVPGAFVTMLVKAIEREIVAKISKSQFDVSPAIILQHFNRTMKKLLKQETNDTLSNSGFDGGIVYINKKEGFIRFAGAQTSLFCVQQSQLSTIKGERQSIGYKKSNPDFTFTDHQIELDDSSCFYLATDGFLDQTGGNKGLVFGKRRFLDMIRNNYQKPFSEQQQIFMESLAAYQGTHARKDDITVVGFRL